MVCGWSSRNQTPIHYYCINGILQNIPTKNHRGHKIAGVDGYVHPPPACNHIRPTFPRRSNISLSAHECLLPQRKQYFWMFYFFKMGGEPSAHKPRLLDHEAISPLNPACLPVSWHHWVRSADGSGGWSSTLLGTFGVCLLVFFSFELVCPPPFKGKQISPSGVPHMIL